jgi:hypothetical protein
MTAYTSKGPLGRAVKLQWRNVTQDGSFADVASTGEINWTADTVLVDDTKIPIENTICDAVGGYDFQQGEESEGNNRLPPVTGTFILADDYYCEHQWALSPSGATAGEEYELQLYDITEGTALWTCLASITMATVVSLTLDASRFANATRVDQSGDDDYDVIDWDPDDDFILATTVYTAGLNTVDRSIRLQWRNLTDSGSFADVSTTGEIRYTADTDLVDGNPLTSGERINSSPPSVDWEDGLECEGDNTIPSTGQFTYTKDYFTEHHFALDCSNALYSKEYEFRLIDEQLVLPVATCVPTITMMADPAGGCPRQMMHYARQRRS